MTDISTFSWGHAALRLEFLVDTGRRVRIVGFGPDAPVGPPAAPADDAARAELPGVAGLPLVEVTVTGYGRWLANERFIQTVVGERLAYQGHEEYQEDGWLVLRVDLADPESGLAAEAFEGCDVETAVLFPQDAKTELRWRPGQGELTVRLTEPETACLIALG